MKRSRFLKAFSIAAVLAIMLGSAQAVYAQQFQNCITIWYYTECYTIDLGAMAGDANSFGFEAMYRLCQMVGLCP
jgi:hypothetical protein